MLRYPFAFSIFFLVSLGWLGGSLAQAQEVSGGVPVIEEEVDPNAPPALDSWMSRLPDSIPLASVLLPGSHDAGTYSFRAGSAISVYGDQPAAFALLDQVDGEPSEDLKGSFARWARTQRFTILGQLRAGFRYFDLRLEKKNLGTNSPPDGAVYIVHGMYGPHLDEVLKDVQTFVRAHPSEVVLLDISALIESRPRPPRTSFAQWKAAAKDQDLGSTPAAEAAVRSSLKTYLEGHLIPPPGSAQDLRLSSLRSRGNVIVFTKSASLRTALPSLWSRSQFFATDWDAKAMSGLDTLRPFLRQKLAGRDRAKFYSMQWLRTPDQDLMLDAEFNRKHVDDALGAAQAAYNTAKALADQAREALSTAQSTLNFLEGPTRGGIQFAQNTVQVTSNAYQVGMVGISAAQTSVNAAQNVVLAEKKAVALAEESVQGLEGAYRAAQSAVDGAERAWNQFLGPLKTAARWAANLIGQGAKWDQLQSQLNSSRSHRDQVSGQLSGARNQLRNAQTQLDRDQAKLRQAQASLAADRARVKAAKQAYLSAKEDLETVNTKLAEAKKSVAEKQAQLAAAEAKAKSALDRLQREKTRLKHVPPSLLALGDSINHELGKFLRSLGQTQGTIVTTDSVRPELAHHLVAMSLQLAGVGR